MKRGEDNSFGVLSVGLATVSLVLSLNNHFGSLILAIVAIVLAKKQEKISKNNWSKWGRNIGIIAIILCIIFIILAVVVIIKNPDLLQQLSAING